MTLRLLALALAASTMAASPPPAVVTHSTLPSKEAARALLESFVRHREWIQVPLGAAAIPAYVVWPARAGKAAVVLVSQPTGVASDWVRAVGDQVASEGFIAVVPDAAGHAPHARAADAVGRHMAAHPAASGTLAFLTLDTARQRMTARAGTHERTFALSPANWPHAIAFLMNATGNTAAVPVADEHAGHMALRLEQQQPGGAGRGGAPGITTKLPHLPAGYFTAESTFASSPRRREWIDLPVGTATVRTLIVHPDGAGPAPVVVVMQHGTGMDPSMRAVADQLALEGFIAVAPDLWSGLGPNGGGWDSFPYVDDGIRAAAGRLTTDDTMRRYRAAREYALKLPRANGKSASIGFCAGGEHSFRFAEVAGLNAAVVFYGAAPDDATMARISAPVLGLYGENDARITSTVAATAASMTRLGKMYEPHVYAQATHSFVLFQDIGGNPAAVDDGWTRAIAFIRTHTK